MADYYNGDLQETGGGGSTDLTQVNSRITTAEADIDQLETDVAAIDTSSLDTRLTTAESDIDQLETDVAAIDTSSLDTRLTSAESDIDQLETDVGNIDTSSLDTRLTTAESEIDDVDTRLRDEIRGLGTWFYGGRFGKDADADFTTMADTGEWHSEDQSVGVQEDDFYDIFFSDSDLDDLDFNNLSRNIAGLTEGDFLYIRSGNNSNILTITTGGIPQSPVENTDVLRTVGTWEDPFDIDDYDEITLYYKKSGSILHAPAGAQKIWTPSGGRVVTRSTGTTYTLDAGHRFSLYSELIVLYDNQGSSGVDSKNYNSSTFPMAAFTESSDYRIEVHTASGYWKHVRYMTDTTFRIPYGGGNNLGILGLWGVY